MKVLASREILLFWYSTSISKTWNAAGPILKHLHPFYRDEAACHNGVEDRQECVDLLLGIDDLNHHGQVLRQAQNLCCVYVTWMPEPDVTPKDCGAGQVHFASLEHNRFVQRSVAGPIVLAEKDTKQYRGSGKLHAQVHFMALMLPASMYPAHTAIRQQITDIATLVPARNHPPSFMRLSVCKLNDENVV
jgi:hypothetical protein